MDTLARILVVSLFAAITVGAIAINPLFGVFVGLVLFLG